MKVLLSILLILCTTLLLAGNGQGSIGGRSGGLAGSGIFFSDVWAAENNPAGLGFMRQWGAGISYQNHFLLPEMAHKSAVFSLPTNSGSFGLSVRQFGYELYSENKVGLSYGQALSKTFSLGIQLNYLNTQIAESYGSTGGLSGNIGLYAKITEKLSLAALLVNPNKLELAEAADERYPSRLNLGLAYEISSKVLLLSEVEKDIDFEENIKLGMEYHPNEMFFFRLGYATQPSQSTFGFGLLFNSFVLDVSSGIYSEIGLSPQVSLSFIPGKAKAE